jgi:hypothetical protein
MRLYGGHVAYGVRPEFRGNHFAGRALRLLMPLLFGTGCLNCGLLVILKMFPLAGGVKFAGAELVEIIDLPPDVDMYQAGEREV